MEAAGEEKKTAGAPMALIIGRGLFALVDWRF